MIDNLSKLVPGFDFLQNLMQGAGESMPMGQWVAPTFDPAEIGKRISELKTVQFWLEQNARMIGTTVQALEVQRMTLSTLQTMNLPMEGLRQAMALSDPRPAPAPEPAARAAEPAPEPADDAAPTPAADPMQWWSALTRQFSEIATRAMTESSALAARTMAAAAPQAEAPAAAKASAKAGEAAKPAAKTRAARTGANRVPPRRG